jgi:hypothetical protein
MARVGGFEMVAERPPQPPVENRTATSSTTGETAS